MYGDCGVVWGNVTSFCSVSCRRMVTLGFGVVLYDHLPDGLCSLNLYRLVPDVLSTAVLCRQTCSHILHLTRLKNATSTTALWVPGLLVCNLSWNSFHLYLFLCLGLSPSLFRGYSPCFFGNLIRISCWYFGTSFLIVTQMSPLLKHKK